MLKKLLLFLILSPWILSCQNSLSGEFTPHANFDFVILYRITSMGKVYVKNTGIKDGVFKIELDSTVAKGNYRIVYNLPEDKNYFDIIYDGKNSVAFTFSEKSGVNFKDKENKILSEYLKNMDSISGELDAKLMVENPDAEEIKNLIQNQEKIQSKAEKESKGLFASVFIKANRPYIPADFNNRNIYFAEKKNNFFKNMDFENEQLQNSYFPLKLIKIYYNEFIKVQGPSFYRSIINDIYFEIRNSSPEFQKTVLYDFWNYLVEQNKISAANYLAENYLIDLASQLNDTVLVEKLELYKSLSVGAIAPDFSWTDENGKGKSLSSLEGSEYYILAFWSSDCSHCMEQMPVLDKKMQVIPSEKIKVIAIGLEMDQGHWKETIPNLPNFMHVLKIGENRAALTLQYNITGTPTFYVLGGDMRIIAKPRGQKSLYGIIESLEAYKK